MSAEKVVVFELDGGRYALMLSAVIRVVRMVEIRPLPEAPAIVLGVVDVEGVLTPVLDIRQRFRLPPKVPTDRDQLIIARTRSRTVALVVDLVADLKTLAENDLTKSENIFPGLDYLRGIARVKGEEDMIMVHDLTSFLSEPEEAALDRALNSPSSA